MSQDQVRCRERGFYDIAINVLGNLITAVLLSCIPYVLNGRLGWFPEHLWWLVVIGLVAVAVAGFRVAGKAGMRVGVVVGGAAVTLLAVIGVWAAVRAGWFAWLSWFPEHPWPMACVTFMVIFVVAFCAVWYAGRLELESILAIVGGLAVLGLMGLGIAKLVQLGVFGEAWNLVAMHPWLTSFFFLVGTLLVVNLVYYIHNIRSSARVGVKSIAAQREKQSPRHIRLVGSADTPAGRGTGAGAAGVPEPSWPGPSWPEPSRPEPAWAGRETW